MKTDDPVLQQIHHILDALLLLFGEATVAALFSALRTFSDYPALADARHVLDGIEAAEQRGWLCLCREMHDGACDHPSTAERQRARAAYEAWLPEAEDLTWDPIGLTCQITDQGRAEWQRWAETEGVGLPEPWRLQQLISHHEIHVWAVDVAAANRILESWLSSHSEVELVRSSKKVRPVAGFRLASGRTLENGVEVTFRYRDQSATTASVADGGDQP